MINSTIISPQIIAANCVQFSVVDVILNLDKFVLGAFVYAKSDIHLEWVSHRQPADKMANRETGLSSPHLS